LNWREKNNMLSALIKLRITEVFDLTFNITSSTGQKRKSRKPIIFFVIIYLVGYLAYMMVNTFSSLLPVGEKGYGNLYFTASVFGSFIITVMMLAISGEKELFESKDNDTLLSMPIPIRYILISRMSAMYLLNIFFSAVTLIPTAVIYWMRYGADIYGILIFTALIFFVPLFSVAVVSFIGWILSLLQAHVSNKTLVPGIYMFILIAAVVWMSSAYYDIMSVIIQNPGKFEDNSRLYIYPAYLFGNAVNDHNLFSMIILILICFAVFWAAVSLMSRNFLSILSANKNIKKVKYIEKPLKTHSPVLALAIKDVKRLSNNLMVLINVNFGTLLIVAAGVFAVIMSFSGDSYNAFSEVGIPIGVIFTITVTFMIFMSPITGSLISLEGKNFWFIKSIPIDAYKIFISKLLCQLILVMPSAIFYFFCYLFLDRSLQGVLLALLMPTVACIFSGMFGLFINLQMTNFNFMNDMMAVKRSGSTAITLLVQLAFFGGLAALYFYLLRSLIDLTLFCYIVTLLMAVLTALINFYMKTNGVMKFDTL
jgi:ABC-2 type transport system permease protein